jgi:hypothetical protein
MSHRFLKNSPAFAKTMFDIKRMRVALGFSTIPERLQEWYKKRSKETYNYSHPSLMRGKSAFFSGDGVNYVYDHDSIHIAMAHLERPAYTYFKRDDHEVAVDRKKWDTVSENTRLYSVLEETYVLALERSQIPYKGQIAPITSFRKALEKVCTSITSGWWRDYAWEHHDEAMSMYDNTYVARFWAAVDSGVVKPHNAESKYSAMEQA